MKKIFPGYFKKTDQEIAEIWQSCDFVLDTNVLHNLYRYSDKTKDDFLNLLNNNKVSPRLWLPHRVAVEFLDNRNNVIKSQIDKYDSVLLGIDEIQKELDNFLGHPFISDSHMKDTRKAFKKLSEELDKNSKINNDKLFKDSILEKVNELFEDKVGPKFNDDELRDIIKEGEERYSDKIPPGYKDSDKAKQGAPFLAQCRKYGDLIIWKQIICHAKTNKVDIVLVSDDTKEDWVTEIRGQKLGPRPELINEFEAETSQRILIYSPGDFTKYSGEQLNEQVSDESNEEIDKLTINKHMNDLLMRKNALNVEAKQRMNRSNLMSYKLKNMKKGIYSLDSSSSEKFSSAEFKNELHEIENTLGEINKETFEILREIQIINSEINNLKQD